MILNPIICEKCGRELQPDMLGVNMRDGDLIRVCGFCGDEVKVK